MCRKFHCNFLVAESYRKVKQRSSICKYAPERPSKFVDNIQVQPLRRTECIAAADAGNASIKVFFLVGQPVRKMLSSQDIQSLSEDAYDLALGAFWRTLSSNHTMLCKVQVHLYELFTTSKAEGISCRPCAMISST